MTASALWTEVKATYAPQDLLNLTNIHDTAAIVVDDTVGESAAQSVIDLWPAYAQVDYDTDNALHKEVASMAVIAKLFERGGVASDIARLKWDEVFTDGVIKKLKMTGPRAHGGPSSSNVYVKQSSEALSNTSSVLPWSDREAYPGNDLMPRRKGPII